MVAMLLDVRQRSKSLVPRCYSRAGGIYGYPPSGSTYKVQDVVPDQCHALLNVLHLKRPVHGFLVRAMFRFDALDSRLHSARGSGPGHEGLGKGNRVHPPTVGVNIKFP